MVVSRKLLTGSVHTIFQVANPQAGKLIDVKLPKGYILMLTGYTLEHVTCGIFKAAPHNVVGCASRMCNML